MGTKMQTRGTKLHFDTGIVSAVYDDVFVSVSSFDIQCCFTVIFVMSLFLLLISDVALL